MTKHDNITEMLQLLNECNFEELKMQVSSPVRSVLKKGIKFEVLDETIYLMQIIGEEIDSD